MTPWKRYAALGDSLTEGYGMDPVEGVEPIPWAARLAAHLSVGQPDLEFLNLGYRDLRAAAIRERHLPGALAWEPDLVTVTAGPNDTLYPDFAREPLERELDGIFEPLVEAGATVLTFRYMNLAGTGLLPEDGARWVAERMEILHAATDAAAARHGVLVVDLHSLPESADPAFFSADLRHANALGQRFIAERMIEFLETHARTAAAA